MSNGTNILNVVKGLALLLARNSSPRIPWVDTLQDTETTKVLDGNLEHLDALGSPNEGRLQTGIFLLLLLSHARQFAFGAHFGMGSGLEGLLLRLSFDSITHGCCFGRVGAGGAAGLGRPS